ncbi:MAG: hypothetical protein NZ890_14395, partial [Myxococcota bacterium]|nr:hypothetical protein [Myxococcota bacterium]
MTSTRAETAVAPGPFGRSALLDWIEFALRAPGAILALWGERRIGKTTLLRRLEQHLPSPSFLPVYLDLAGRGRRPLRQLVHDLATAICAALGHWVPLEDDGSGSWLQERFLPSVQRLLGEECRLVLALDHIDRLGGWSEPPAGQAHAPELVAYLQRLAEWPHLALVLALGPRPEDLEPAWRPLLRGARYRQVPLLDEPSARMVLTAPRPAGWLRFSEPALQRALRLTAGHPQLLELLWERLYRARLAPTTAVLAPQDVDGAVPEVLDAGEGVFAWIWDSLRPPERLVLSLVAAAERRLPLNDKSLEERAGLPEAGAVQEALLHRELLERAPGGALRVRSELFGRWIATREPPEAVTEEVDLPLAEQLYRLAEKCHRRQD